MADKWPIANGSWSDPGNWNDGTKPQAGDDVYADGKTVTIDEDATVASVQTTQRSGGTAGGGFTLAAGIMLTANVIAGTTTCVTRSAAGFESTVAGNATGGSGQYAYGAINNSTGTLTIAGDSTGGSGLYACGAINNSTGPLTIVGNATGGSGQSAYGAYNGSTGTFTIAGNATGGSGQATDGAVNNSSGTLTVAGNATGGSGLNARGAINNSTGTLTIAGDSTGGSGTSAYGAYNLSAGTLTVSGLAIGSEFGNGSVGFSLTAGVYGSQNGATTVGGLKFGSRGLSPVYGNVFIASFADATCYVRKSDFAEGVLVDSASTNNPPATHDVRAGVSYTTGGVLTGTLAVPAAGSVALGVPVDAGAGTAVLTQAAVEAAAAAAIAAAEPIDANITQVAGVSFADGVREALGMADADMDDQLDAILVQATAAAEDSGGTGARTCVITVDDGTDPLEGARVRVTKGAESWLQPTGVSGQATFNLDDGSWTVAITLAGYMFSGDILVVDGNETETYSMTAAGFTPSVEPDSVTVWWRVIDEDGRPCGAGEGTVRIRLIAGPNVAGFAWDKSERISTTDANGYVEFPDVPAGCTLRAKLGTASAGGEWFDVTIPSDATSPYEPGEILGTVP